MDTDPQRRDFEREQYKLCDEEDEKENMTLDERVFRKMGWEFIEDTMIPYWEYPGMLEKLTMKNVIGKYDLPKISSNWEICAKWLVPFMQKKGYGYCIPLTFNAHKTPNGNWFEWESFTNKTKPMNIEDNKIALAACYAFINMTEIGEGI